MADFPGGRHNLTMLYANQGKVHQSKKHYEFAINTDSAFIPSMVNLAIIYNRLNENDKAEELYRKLIKHSPQLDGIHYSMGLLLAEEKRYEEAIKYLEDAVDIQPGNARINYNLALVYQQINKINRAEYHFLEAIEKDQDVFDYPYALAIMYLNNNQKARAGEMIEVIKEKFPNHPTLQQLLNSDLVN
ncbi:MAG: tetratricopeptide repeat protein [Bacteroidetes bacterium]|jgi:tetratricopeptide (TPR) repeat protein|nr:tetratricopeptide repeat protein [Bacteroidota bacterium]